MPRTLTPEGAAWLADMPPYYADDSFVWAVLNAGALEFARIEAAAQALVTYGFAINGGLSDEEIPLALLRLWELQLDIPEIPGITLEQRGRAIRARLTQRRASSEADWFDALSDALGTTAWSYTTMPDGGTILIHLPYGSDQYSAQEAMRFARKITPAHLALIFDFGNAFILDYSLLDTGTL